MTYYAKVLNMFRKLKIDINTELRAFLKNADSFLALRSSSPLLASGIKDFLLSDGKRIRPILFILSYLGYTQRRSVPNKKLLRSALSFELLHDFLLIHDDIIDSSDLRRGKPTLHNYFNSKLKMPKKDLLGSHLGIVAGDIIFSLAAGALISLDEKPSRKEKALTRFTEIAALTGIGEFIDVVNNTTKIDKITQKDIFLTYTLKTAKYTFEGPLVIGAILAGAQKKDISLLSKLGTLLGEAFQIQDDLLDIFYPSKKTGKPALSDIVESKKTLLVWKAYRDIPAQDKKMFKRLFEKKQKTKRDLLSLKNFIKTSSAGEFCQRRVLSLLKEADSILCQVKLKPKYKTILQDFSKESFSLTSNLKI